MKLIFKSLINNNACITGARRKGKWWVSIVLFFISLIFAVIPTFVTQITTKGSSLIFPSSTCGLENAMVDFVDNKKGTIELKIEDGTLTSTGWDAVEGIYTYAYTNTTTNTVDARFYYAESYTTTFINTTIKDHECTRVFFGKDIFYMDLVKMEKRGESTTFGCSHAWNKFSNGDLMDFFIDEDCVSLNDKVASARKNLVKLVDTTYNYDRVINSFTSVGLYSAINAVIVLLMGLMIWILTRGKNNAFRHFKFYEGLEISAWASLAPAVLTIPLGFLIQGFANMMFPLLLGVRCMWLASKSLRPDGLGYEEPKEVKTVNIKSK